MSENVDKNAHDEHDDHHGPHITSYKSHTIIWVILMFLHSPRLPLEIIYMHSLVNALED